MFLCLYRYNGLGQRTGRTENSREEHYLLDLTRPYHNLLSLTSETKEQTFYWDGNVEAMEEMPCGSSREKETSGSIQPSAFHYYLQDELGSPLRVSGYEGRTENGYLSYGYDEFGNDLYADLAEAGIPNPYAKQGEEQPFGYTGYRKDAVSGTYFAQAREYLPEAGRFTAEDVVRGTIAVPVTLNWYGYCRGNPVRYVDLDGNNSAQTMQDAWYTASQLSQSDGPLPFADIIALLILAGSAIYAGGTIATDYIGQKIKAIQEKTKEEAKEKAVAIEKTEDGQTIIYRKGNGNHANFTPRPGIDYGGLSYQFTRPVGTEYHMTTMEAVNATGVLAVVQDGENHVSVIPTNTSELQSWMDTRPGVLNNGSGPIHPYTILMEEITIAYFNEEGLPTVPGRLKNMQIKGRCLLE